MPSDPRSVLITGSGRRIGAYLARFLAAHGYIVHLHARAGSLEPFATELREKFGVSVFTHHVDLEDSRDVQGWTRSLRNERFPPTLLVNNASPFPPGHTMTDIEHLEEGLRVHVLAPTLLLNALPPSGGHIVNMLDARLRLLDGVRPGYELSKHALAAHTLLAAARLTPRIRVNAIAPGLVLPAPGHDNGDLERLARQRSPLSQPGRLEDVAAALHFLESATSVTGQVIHVDAGEHLGAPQYG